MSAAPPPLSDDAIACAGIVQRGDPDRFRAAMAAPVAARGILFPLYAFNVEVSRAPWVTQEAMIAEMRLQWWRDALAEIAEARPVRRHEVVSPLAEILPADLAAQLDESIAIRRWDIYRDPFEDEAHFTRYIDLTSGTLMWIAARLLGQLDEAPVRDIAYAMGIANFLRAIPALEAAGRIPLLDGTADGVRALATTALSRLQQADQRRIVASARPALLPAWQARALLRQARARPDRVAAGTLGQSETAKSIGLMRAALTRRI